MDVCTIRRHSRNGYHTRPTGSAVADGGAMRPRPFLKALGEWMQAEIDTIRRRRVAQEVMDRCARRHNGGSENGQK